MSTLTLIIGNKNYSSWSLRPWLMLRQARIPFAEVRIALDTPETDELLAPYSPSGRVPVLLDGNVKVWESLAICEYVAERFPEIGAWPAERLARAAARSMACEMHAGFSALRDELPFNCRSRRVGIVPSPAAREDIERIVSLWSESRRMFAHDGPWLCGAFTIVDAMFAPVVLRFGTYGVELPESARAYSRTVQDHPAIREWIEAARQETEVIDADERGEVVSG